MKKLYLILVPIILGIVVIACDYNVDPPTINPKEPNTFISLFPDSSVSQQQSKLSLHWWGDYQDGLIVGYFISWDNTNWSFTSKNDSSIAFPLQGLDTIYNFQVAAVGDNGNGVYDDVIMYKGVNIGHEPFIDKDNNGIYNQGETFIDLGMIDPSPASLRLPLKNTPPVIEFLKDKVGSVIALPETTFTVASFSFNAEDLDGNETISKLYIALNDTSTKIEIPGNSRFITIKAVPPFNSDVVNAQVFIGSSINQPFSKNISNLKLNDFNTFYVWGEDIAGAKSNMIRMPEANASKKWFVKKIQGQILILDDNANADDGRNSYMNILSSIGLGDKVDIYDIGLGRTSTTYGNNLPKFVNPMFIETLKLFKVVLWYTSDNATLEAAQISVRPYLNAGGKLLLSMQLPQFPDVEALKDFLPVDSLTSPVNFLLANTKVNATEQALALGYPNLQVDAAGSAIARTRGWYTNPLGTVPLYNITYQGTKLVIFKSIESNLVFSNLPLHRLNGGDQKINEFFRKVFVDEFGVNR